jgi:hypothetical protein
MKVRRVAGIEGDGDAALCEWGGAMAPQQSVSQEEETAARKSAGEFEGR